ncbi:MAG TPA: hypothetical protein VFM06_00590 [Candidatus Limnocylindria bacterium]|nr:hypothetical protein [Candidatus Limnocylindria bacterium]
MASAIGTAGVRPALFAPFADLAALRYDYPIVLHDGDDERPAITALSAVIDDLLASEAPPGVAGQRMRRAVRRLEGEMRRMSARGQSGTLTELWATAAGSLGERDAQVAQDLTRARAGLARDGLVVDCDQSMPVRAVTHLWRREQRRKALAMRRTIDGLRLRLGDLVRADHLRSGGGRGEGGLRAGVGTSHEGLFDFALMASLLARPSGDHALSDTRRARIDRTLAVLRDERFFATREPYVFAFDRVADALTAHEQRRAAMTELVRSIAVAELELRGAYVEDRHDAYFDRFDATALTPADLSRFPDYLVHCPPDAEGADRAMIIDALTSGAPIKVLFVTDDAFGIGARLATTAMGLGDTFVLQASAARLYAVRERATAALRYRGPALVSVYVPASIDAAGAPYLVAAAATESRAFPTFSYDPSAGTGWGERLALADDPQPDRAWPLHELRYADATLQRRTETVAFTVADFALCDPRRAGDVGVDAPERAVPIEMWLDDPDGGVPFVRAIEPDGALRRLAVSADLVRATRRAAEAWRRLQELAALGRQPVVADLPDVPGPPAAVSGAAAATPVSPVASGPAEASPDEPYIETVRCATCNECTNLNPRMFAYDGNRQAYIKDVTAGTFRELVEAAEACQVAIIHPGRPRDPNEPGLDDLLKRAEAFA